MTEYMVFLPWRGEFGQMIMNYVRWVHRECPPDDSGIVRVVCCRRGDEALFPDADEFYYDWEQVPDRKKNTRLLKSADHLEYLESLKLQIHKKLGGKCFFCDPPKKMEVDPRYNFKPEPKTVMGELEIDVLLCPRWRQHGKHRNYQHWMEVATRLQACGLRVALAGMKQTSVDVTTVPEALKSWSYDNLDSTLHMMNRAKIVVATDAGLAHLAVLNQSPLFVIYDQPGKEAGKPQWPWVLPRMQKYATAKCDPIINGWNNPEVVVKEVCQFLGEDAGFLAEKFTIEEQVLINGWADKVPMVGGDLGPPPGRRQNLLICSMVYEYQKRYWWQLSSLVSQVEWEGHPVPNIVAHADISARDQNYGWNDALYRTFTAREKDGWKFDHTQRKWPRVEPREQDPYGQRGNIRSKNLKDALEAGWADWILFNDADMVYDQQFFSHLMTLVDPAEERVYATPRWTMMFEDGYRLVDSVKYRNRVVEDPAGKIKAFDFTKPMWQSARGRISGAGFFQLISVAALRRRAEKDPKFLEYIDHGRSGDHNTLDPGQTHITRSDRRFRLRLGGIVPLSDIRPQYHINHWRRDSDEYVEGMLH